MKKNLVIALALVFVLGIAGTAFAAANPFVDVPAKHWAYGAVSKLQKSGIVDGYGDGTFRGDKTMTRYEMAQVVAKAMAKSDKADAANKALIDKLAVEFAAELNNLGVRVAKLEKQVGTVKMTGDARVRWSKAGPKADGGSFYERVRLNLSADVNEKTSFLGRIMIPHTGQGATEGLRLAAAEFTTKDVFNSGTTLTLGRTSAKLGVSGYVLETTCGMVDGAKLAFGNQVKMTVGYADFTNATAVAASATLPAFDGIKKAGFVTANYNTSKATSLAAGYITEKNSTITATHAVETKEYVVGFTTKIDKNWGFMGEYARNVAVPSSTSDGKFYLARLSYKGANAKVQGSWGAAVEYYRAATGSVMTRVSDYATGNSVNLQGDKKAIDLMVSYTLAKNITMDAFQTFNTKTVSTGAKSDNWSRIQVNYFF